MRGLIENGELITFAKKEQTQNKMSREPITIDVESVVKSKLGKRGSMVPGFVYRYLERVIRQDRLNELLVGNFPKTGVEFCRGVLSDLNVRFNVVNPELLPSRSDQRVLFVSNHPLGGLDGMILAVMLGDRGIDAKFVVNDLLDAVEPLRDIFVPVNKHGRQSRQACERLEEVFDSESAVLMFPAGMVSRRRGGVVSDLEWKKMFVNRAIKSRRDIVPLRFVGENSSFFYKFASLRERVGLKFNIEMVRLPAEVIAAEGSEFSIVVGNRIPYQRFKGGTEAYNEAQTVRSKIYELN